MALSNTFDTNTPLGSAAPSVLDNRIRQAKAAIQERMNDHNGSADEGDHYWPFDDTLTTQVLDTDTGEHRKITLRTLTAAEVAALDTSKAVLYRLVTDGEYYMTDGAGNTIQLTNGGIGAIGHSVTAKTSDYTITAAELENNRTFVNDGASGTVNFSLPAGVAGYKVSFVVTDAQYLKVTANGTEKLRYKGTQSAAGGYIQSNVVGTAFSITYSGDDWVITIIANEVYYDGTTTVFGAGHSPASYVGGESITLPNGLILKMGSENAVSGTVTFGTAFPTAAISVNITMNKTTSAGLTNPKVSGLTVTGFSYEAIDADTTPSMYWMAMGY